MNVAVEHWLTRFAAGAGSQYVWTLVVVDFERGRGVQHLLRAKLTAQHEMCPMADAATLDLGTIYHMDDWEAGVYAQGLTLNSATQAIIEAADDERGADPQIRTRLLRICRLTEEG